jgi:DNA mismatch endonuclease (patch repair protein)
VRTSMVDTLNRAARSAHMARIKSRDTVPERRLRCALHANGLRYRLHVKALPGRPDLVFSKYRAVVFVHGCFWHRHTRCKLAYTPKSNVSFWRKKFAENVSRDRRQLRALTNQGWRVLVAWECALRSPVSLKREVDRISSWIRVT